MDSDVPQRPKEIPYVWRWSRTRIGRNTTYRTYHKKEQIASASTVKVSLYQSKRGMEGDCACHTTIAGMDIRISSMAMHDCDAHMLRAELHS